jgi:release factor glutamine methyltransferase
MQTIADCLKWAKAELSESDSAQQDVQVLLANVLQQSKAYLYTWPEKVLSADQLSVFQHCVALRKAGKPVAYIVGYRDFWGLRLQVSEATLIPRPETELLVEQALDLSLPAAAKVLDLGTGTGAIALALASERTNWQIVGVDSREDVVALAKQNGQRHRLQQVKWLQSDWFEKVEGRFDLILSNPPYVETDSHYLQQGDLRFEPSSALTSGSDGLNALRHIINQAPNYLTEQAWLILEHGMDQAESVRQLMTDAGFIQITSKRDLAGHERMTFGLNIKAMFP